MNDYTKEIETFMKECCNKKANNRTKEFPCGIILHCIESFYDSIFERRISIFELYESAGACKARSFYKIALIGTYLISAVARRFAVTIDEIETEYECTNAYLKLLEINS